MKLLLENWRENFLGLPPRPPTRWARDTSRDWRETSWEADGEKVTIGDVVDHLGDGTVDLNVLKLLQQLPPLPTREPSRVAAASLEYPIIVVKRGGQYRFVLDGNHRLQKAINEKVKSIKAKILDLDNPETPEVFKKMFGGAG
jgi:hypothetical protein